MTYEMYRALNRGVVTHERHGDDLVTVRTSAGERHISAKAFGYYTPSQTRCRQAWGQALADELRKLSPIFGGFK